MDIVPRSADHCAKSNRDAEQGACTELMQVNVPGFRLADRGCAAAIATLPSADTAQPVTALVRVRLCPCGAGGEFVSPRRTSRYIRFDGWM